MKRHCILGREKEGKENGDSSDVMRSFILSKEGGSVLEVTLRFPYIFGGRVTFPYG